MYFAYTKKQGIRSTENSSVNMRENGGAVG